MSELADNVAAPAARRRKRRREKRIACPEKYAADNRKLHCLSDGVEGARVFYWPMLAKKSSKVSPASTPAGCGEVAGQPDALETYLQDFHFPRHELGSFQKASRDARPCAREASVTGIVVVLRHSVVHAGALKVVSGADTMLRQDRACDRLRLIAEACKDWRPAAGVAVVGVSDGRKNLANGPAHVVCCAKTAQQLEVHLGSAKPRTRVVERATHPDWMPLTWCSSKRH